MSIEHGQSIAGNVPAAELADPFKASHASSAFTNCDVQLATLSQLIRLPRACGGSDHGLGLRPVPGENLGGCSAKGHIVTTGLVGADDESARPEPEPLPVG